MFKKINPKNYLTEYGLDWLELTVYAILAAIVIWKTNV